MDARMNERETKQNDKFVWNFGLYLQRSKKTEAGWIDGISRLSSISVATVIHSIHNVPNPKKKTIAHKWKAERNQAFDTHTNILFSVKNKNVADRSEKKCRLTTLMIRKKLHTFIAYALAMCVTLT